MINGASPLVCSPFQTALGHAFATLAPGVQRAHLAPLVATGIFDVEHGVHWAVPVLVSLLNLPAAGRAIPVLLAVTADGDQLLWTRQIGTSQLWTRQRASGASIVERSGIGAIVFGLTVDDGALVYRQTSFQVAGIAVPRGLAPHVDARVSPARDGWRVEVHITWRTHLVCRYSGRMTIE